MATVDGASRVNLDENELRITMEELLERVLGRPLKVNRLKRKASPFATVFPADIVSLDLHGGEKISVFLKHLGPEDPDHPEKQCRDREIRIYEELLRDDYLPVVKYYGSRWNETTQRYELFLAYIDDYSLKYQGLEYWPMAARRLAHLHAYFAARPEKLLACDFLLRFDAISLYKWAERALSAVADDYGKLAGELEGVVNSYGRVAEMLAQQPVTLVHNDLSPKNIIVDRASHPVRICFIDWELAGVGCGLLDLVHLKYGLDPLNDQKMCTVYCAELTGTRLLPSNPRDLASLFAACELHKTLNRLWCNRVWRLPSETVAHWISEAKQYLSLV